MAKVSATFAASLYEEVTVATSPMCRVLTARCASSVNGSKCSVRAMRLSASSRPGNIARVSERKIASKQPRSAVRASAW